MKKIILLFFITTNIIFGAETQAKKYSAYLVGDENGNILMSENIDAKLPLASLTKVMTLLVTFDAIERGEVSENDIVSVSKKATQVGESTIPMRAGEKFTLKELIEATAIQSANNAAYAIAEYVGGDINGFVKMMNQKAEEIGVGDQVTYYTPTGLPAHLTGAKEDIGTPSALYEIMQEAVRYKKYIELASIRTKKIHNGKITLISKNRLLSKPGFYGLKTGFHDSAGYNQLALSRVANLMGYFVLMGASSEEERVNKVVDLDKKFRSEYIAVSVLNSAVPLARSYVKDGIKNSIFLYPDRNYFAVIKKDADVTLNITKYEELKAPVESGESYASYIVYSNDSTITSGKLFTKENILKKY
ncbi:MAG: D-alanyl-D-alanine carboxypeptidase family protein [Fusobacteriaceae bacterium]